MLIMIMVMMVIDADHDDYGDDGGDGHYDGDFDLEDERFMFSCEKNFKATGSIFP